MTAPHGDNATAWNDLIDQLTPEQIAELESYEGRADITPQQQLNHARGMAEHNVIQALCADIAPPTDVVEEIDEWQEWTDGRHARPFTAFTREVGNTQIRGFGVQHDDGRIERSITVDESDNLTPTSARELATALMDAAAEIEMRSADDHAHVGHLDDNAT